ncbi:MAG TPA: C-type lectin domain-containing protein [Nostocaceae cyanobacterium]|nr:C-type lectin domain-containing protein [Nostocaceae cyanobacterium]
MLNSTWVKKVITTTALTTLGLAGITSTASAAILHTAEYNGNTYHLLAPSSTWWNGAESEAVSLGGHLVTINDAAEDQWIFKTFAPITTDYASRNRLLGKISLWTGLNDAGAERVYKWSSGQPVAYTNWSVGQPQSSVPDEDYAGIFVNFGTPGKWHDIVGNNRLGDLPFGVVEVSKSTKDPASVPEPNAFIGSLLIGSFFLGSLKKSKFPVVNR